MLQLNFRFIFAAAYPLPLVLGKLISLLGCKQVGSIQFMIDEDSYELDFSNIISRYI